MNEFEKLSKERKDLQKAGEVPEWMTTQGYIMFVRKYAYNNETVKGAFHRIASTLAEHYPDKILAYSKFFNLLWKGYLSPSTPIYCNTGTDRGLVVSCAGSYIEDSISGFYNAYLENAVLSKLGFGTSSYLGDIRPRGSAISIGGVADGVVPVFDSSIDVVSKVSQGNCYSDTVEVLSEKGFMSFAKAKELSLRLAQVDDAGCLSFAFPEEFISTYHTGPMVRLKDSKNIDILVTPDHDLVVRRLTRVDHRRVEGRYLNNTKRKTEYLSKIPAHQIKPHRDVYMLHSGFSYGDNIITPEERFKIAFQADGTFVKKSSVAVKFHFSKTRKIERMREILNMCGFSYKEKYLEKSMTTSFYVSVPDAKVFTKNLEWITTDISSTKAEGLLQEIALWDGSIISETGLQYVSTVESCVDKVQMLAALAGYKSRKQASGVRHGNRKELFRVTLSKGNEFGCENIKKSTEAYKGFVYCATMPLGTLVVRDNGHTLVCGNSRRGAWAGYLDIDHEDFWELTGYILKNPVDTNIGWNITDAFIEKLRNQDEEAIKRWNKVLYLRARFGKGYIWKVDTANKLSPQAVKNSGISIKASNLCSEISLPQDFNHTFTCVLSSLNLSKWDEFEDDTIYWSIIFLDCVVSEMLAKAVKYPELKKAVNFTEKSRALGLGVLAFHTYLQEKMVAFDSFEAHMLNLQIFKKIESEAKRATIHLAELLGEPLWCQGLGVRNATLTAIAPTMSSSILCGSVSQGIEPIISNTFNQKTAAGEMQRINPTFAKLAKEKGFYSQDLVDDIAINHNGSVQHLDWLSEEEKAVFKTAFEIDQHALLRLASTRQQFIDQGQSLNLFFGAEEDEQYVAEVHKAALLDPYIKGLYYLRSTRGVKASKGCVACE